MAVASMATAISPPSASISRTRCPFAVPPIAGLHGMCAIVSIDNVQIATSRPMRAAAHAASTPACPAPMTIISWRFIAYVRMELLPYTEALENDPQHFLLRPRSGDLVEPPTRLMKIREDAFLGHARHDRGRRPRQADPRLLKQGAVPHLCNPPTVAPHTAARAFHPRPAQLVDPVVCQRR